MNIKEVSWLKESETLELKESLQLKDDIEGAMQLFMNSGCGGEVSQVAIRVETRIDDLARMVSDLVVSKGLRSPEVRHENPRTEEIVKNFSDISKIRRLLGFEAMISFRRGFEKGFSYRQISKSNSLLRNELDESLKKVTKGTTIVFAGTFIGMC